MPLGADMPSRSPSDELEARLIELEVRYSLLESTVEELGSLLHEANEQIERLRRQLHELQDTSATGSGRTPEGPFDDTFRD